MKVKLSFSHKAVILSLSKLSTETKIFFNKSCSSQEIKKHLIKLPDIKKYLRKLEELKKILKKLLKIKKILRKLPEMKKC